MKKYNYEVIRGESRRTASGKIAICESFNVPPVDYWRVYNPEDEGLLGYNTRKAVAILDLYPCGKNARDYEERLEAFLKEN